MEAKADLIGKAKGYPDDSFFKVPNIMLGDKKNCGWIRTIGAKSFAVYALIAMRYNHGTGSTPYASHKTLAGILGISKTTFEECVASLLAHELIEKMPCGKRRRTTWTYRPKIRVPDPKMDEREGVNRPATGPKDTLNRPVFEGNRPMLSLSSSGQAHGDKATTRNSKSHTRLYTRLREEYVCPENRVTYVLEHLDEAGLSTQVQIAWEYWSYCWEKHYDTAYSPARSTNAQVIAKDKKNLRDKVKAVGFTVLIERMRRCFDICDERFPCFKDGEWLRPVRLDDFVNNRLFDQWIPLRKDERIELPTSPEERLRAVMEKRERMKRSKEAGNRSGGEG